MFKLMLVCSCVIFVEVNACIPYDEGSSVRPITNERLTVLSYSNLTHIHTESPVWDEQTNTLYWVDVLNNNVHALDYDTNQIWTKHISYGEVNVVSPVADSDRLLVAVRSEVYLLDPDKSGDSALRLVAALDVGRPNNILNEGKADAQGRFWAGTKGSQSGNEVAADEATLYCMEAPTFEPRIQLRPVTISNGMAWSLNNSIFYYIDSPTKRVDAFDYNVTTGSIRNRRTIVNTAEYDEISPDAIPDGMTIDRDGCLWVALMFDGSIIRIDPNSKSIIGRYTLPVKKITSMTWGGPSLDQLIVTTSRRNSTPAERAKEPLSGAIFVLRDLGTAGVPVSKVVFPNADQY